MNRLVASPVRLRVTPPGGGLVPEYDTWRQLYFGNTTSAEGAPDFDAESDGMTNAVEFVFNLHPWTADSSAVQPGSGTGGLPSPGRTLINGEPRLTLAYIRRKSGVTYQVRASDSTNNFQSITPVLVEGPVSVSADYERWKVADTVSISDPAVRRRFLRIFVSIP